MGDAASLTERPPDIVEAVRASCARPEAWSLAPPASARSPIRLTTWAARDVASGAVALPESGLRISQNAVPLGTEINRFHRITVPAQAWRLEKVELNPRKPVPPGTPLQGRFVPGEFWELTDDDQLGRAAFEDHPCGAELSDTTVRATESRAADERYETEYEVDEDWFPQPPIFPRFVFALALFGIETYARQLTAGERADRWRLEQHLRFGDAPFVRLQ